MGQVIDLASVRDAPATAKRLLSEVPESAITHNLIIEHMRDGTRKLVEDCVDLAYDEALRTFVQLEADLAVVLDSPVSHYSVISYVPGELRVALAAENIKR